MSKDKALAAGVLVAGIAGAAAAWHIGTQVAEKNRADLLWDGRAECRKALAAGQLQNADRVELTGASGNRFVCQKVFNDKGQPIIKIGAIVSDSHNRVSSETLVILGELDLQSGY